MLYYYQFISWWHFACTKHFKPSHAAHTHTHFTIHKFIATKWKQSWHKVDSLSPSLRLSVAAAFCIHKHMLLWRIKRCIDDRCINFLSDNSQVQANKNAVCRVRRWLSFILLHSHSFVCLCHSRSFEQISSDSINVNSNLMKSHRGREKETNQRKTTKWMSFLWLHFLINKSFRRPSKTSQLSWNFQRLSLPVPF